MSFLSSYQAGVYGDLYQNFMPMAPMGNGSFAAPNAMQLFPEIFDESVCRKMGFGMNPQGSGLAMDFGSGFNNMYSSMWTNKMNQPMITYDSRGRATEGASWNDFERALRHGKHGDA